MRSVTKQPLGPSQLGRYSFISEGQRRYSFSRLGVYQKPLSQAASLASSVRTRSIHSRWAFWRSGRAVPWRKSQYSAPHTRLAAYSSQLWKAWAWTICSSASSSNSSRVKRPQASAARRWPVRSLMSQAR